MHFVFKKGTKLQLVFRQMFWVITSAEEVYNRTAFTTSCIEKTISSYTYFVISPWEIYNDEIHQLRLILWLIKNLIKEEP